MTPNAPPPFSRPTPLTRNACVAHAQDLTGVNVEYFERVPGEIDPDVSCPVMEGVIVHMIHRHRGGGLADKTVSVDGLPFEVIRAIERGFGGYASLKHNQIIKAYKNAAEGDRLRSYKRTELVALVEERRMAALGGDKLVFCLDRPLPPCESNESSSASTLPASGLRIRANHAYSQVSESFKTLFCRRCLVYQCDVHGTDHPRPRQRVDPPPPLPCPVKGLSLPTDRIRADTHTGGANAKAVSTAAAAAAAPGACSPDNAPQQRGGAHGPSDASEASGTDFFASQRFLHPTYAEAQRAAAGAGVGAGAE